MSLVAVDSELSVCSVSDQSEKQLHHTLTSGLVTGGRGGGGGSLLPPLISVIAEYAQSEDGRVTTLIGQTSCSGCASGFANGLTHVAELDKPHSVCVDPLNPTSALCGL